MFGVFLKSSDLDGAVASANGRCVGAFGVIGAPSDFSSADVFVIVRLVLQPAMAMRAKTIAKKLA